MGIREEFAGSFARLSPAQADEILAEHWGIAGAKLERLDTERDDSFQVTTGEREFVLKVAHPADDPLYVNLQTAAMSFAAELEPRLPLQRVLLTRTGEVEPDADGRVARLLTWLPGIPVFDAVPNPEQLELLGEALGLLSSALSTFDHPAAHRDFIWDAGRLHLIESLREEAPWPEIDLAFDLADREAIAALPQQVIHNDFHPGNVLSSGGQITGILDFGDVVYTARVVDVAVALTYFGWHDELIDGFASVVPLRDDERAALPVLVAARFAQRILLNQLLGRHDQSSQLAGLREHLRRI